jgi:F0F1-type ATP synthase assembly protein I
MIKLKDLIKNDFSIRENTSNLAVNSVFKDLERGEKQKVNEEEDKKETNEKKSWSSAKIAGLIATVGVATIGIGKLADAYFLSSYSTFLLNQIGGTYYFGLIAQAGNILIGSAALLSIASIAEKYNLININLKQIFHIPFFSVEYVSPDIRQEENKKENIKNFSTKEVATGLVGDSLLATTLTFVLGNHPILAGINFQPLITAGIALTASATCLYLADSLKEKLKERFNK